MTPWNWIALVLWLGFCISWRLQCRENSKLKAQRERFIDKLAAAAEMTVKKDALLRGYEKTVNELMIRFAKTERQRQETQEALNKSEFKRSILQNVVNDCRCEGRA